MAMGKRRRRARQPSTWVASADLPRGGGYPFYERLNRVVSGKTVGIDATTLEANAALRSIVRRDTGEDYETVLRGLAEASGITTPTRAELARFDRKRPKKGSNDDWTHPQDPDAKVTLM